MQKVKYFFKQNKMLIIIVIILLICSIAIAFGVYAQITSKGIETKINDNYSELKSNFQDIFTNTINKEATAKIDINYEDLLYTKYNIQEQKNGKYNIDAKIPQFKDENEVLQNINTEIFDKFARKILEIANDSSVNITYNLDYASYVNNNIISLVIMCKYKDGANAQRTIVQTYNYDIENNKLLNINDIIAYKNLNKDDVQKEIQNEIKKINSQMENINKQGYNIYIRDPNSDIYNVENTPNFFIGKNNYLYLVYAYGNDDHTYTSQIDLVIF